MAKDETVRVGAGRKSKALADKLNQGMTADILAFPEPADMEGMDVPPVKDFLKASQKSGILFYPADVRNRNCCRIDSGQYLLCHNNQIR